MTVAILWLSKRISDHCCCFFQEPVVEGQCCWSAVFPLAGENCCGTRKSWFTGCKHLHLTSPNYSYGATLNFVMFHSSLCCSLNTIIAYLVIGLMALSNLIGDVNQP